MFRGHTTRTPVAAGCENEQCDLFYLAGHYGNLRKPNLTRLKIWARIWKQNDGKCSRKIEMSRKTLLAVCEACMSIFLSTPGFKGRICVSSVYRGP